MLLVILRAPLRISGIYAPLATHALVLPDKRDGLKSQSISLQSNGAEGRFSECAGDCRRGGRALSRVGGNDDFVEGQEIRAKWGDKRQFHGTVCLYGPIPAVRMVCAGPGRMDNKAGYCRAVTGLSDIGSEETEGPRRVSVCFISPLRSVSPGLEADPVDAPSTS